MAQLSVESPAMGVFSNPYLFNDIIGLIKDPQIEFIMVSGGVGQKTTEIFSISTNSWRNGPDLPQNRYNHGMALVDVDDGDDHSHHREIFIIGGCVDRGVSNSVISLTIPTTTSEMDSTMTKTMKWRVVPNLKVKREGHGVGVVDGKIFVIGGWNGSECLKTIEVFSVKEGKWIDSDDHGHDDSQVPQEMSTERNQMGVAVIGKKIFVIGGWNFTGCLSRVEVLDTETNKWSTLPTMGTARSEMGITVIDDRFIWVLGGDGGSDKPPDSIEIFDVEKNEWSTSLVKLTSPMTNKTIAVGHKIFVFSWPQVLDCVVEVLDIDSMAWAVARKSVIVDWCWTYHSIQSAIGF